MDKFDVCIAGAGVIGLAIAFQLSKSSHFKNKQIVVVDQEANFGHHTSSRNSEVIHAGIYYPADSLKAKLCVRGKQLLYEFCQRYYVPYRTIGKIIVAHKEDGNRLATLQEKAKTNGVTDLIWFDAGRMNDEEPAVKATYGLFSPSTGILDSHSFMQSLLHLAQNNGVKFAPYTQIQAVGRCPSGFTLDSLIDDGKSKQGYVFHSDYFINSAGLDAVSLAKKVEGLDPVHIPSLYMCKGDYYSYSARNPFNHLIYPLPESNTQGLGIHSTVDMVGRLRFGPDSEYVNRRSVAVNTEKTEKFVQGIMNYFPKISPKDLQPAYAGIRPKLTAEGEPPADFKIQLSDEHGIPGLVQLFGIDSPGLTASLAIGEEIVTGIS